MNKNTCKNIFALRKILFSFDEKNDIQGKFVF